MAIWFLPSVSRFPQTEEEWYIWGLFAVIYLLFRWWYYRWKKQQEDEDY